MAGKLFLQICYFSCVILLGAIQMIRTTPLFTLPISESRRQTLLHSFRLLLRFSVNNNNRVVVTDVDKLDTVLQAAMGVGGNIVFLIPQKDFEKRDLGPDLGTGRSYTGQRTAKVMWGQLASSSPTGPGRRKRNSTDGGAVANYLSNRDKGAGGEFRFENLNEAVP